MKQRAGLFILLLVAAVAGWYYYASHGKQAASMPGGTATATAPTPLTVKGDIGGEKQGFLEDPDVVKILNDQYGITVNGSKLGSIEMVKGATSGQDFLWPSSQVALDLYKNRGGKLTKADVVFNSPIVLYSWDFVTEALMKEQIVQKTGESYYIIDFPKLVRMVNTGTKWKDIGLTQLYGRISIRTTDPTKSNSGMMFAGLLANVLNGGEVVDDTTVKKALPELKTFFGKLGFMEEGSAGLFTQFLKTGEGANPIIVGYESQMVEFSIAHPEYRDMLKQHVRILYPRPTVWSSHPLIALNDNGARFLQACQDDKLQKIAWEHHGFRSGVIGVQNDAKVLQIAGIPEKIEYVIPMPTARVMDRIIESLGTK